MYKSIIIFLIFLMTILFTSNLSAQAVLFDFDNAPLYSSLPIDLTVNGITAHFSATGQGYSIQDNSAPVVPLGFTGRFIYPNSIYISDLIIRYDQTLTDFSIMYSVQELACDTSATMRVTAYINGSFVGTNTKIASAPGTWPVDTLRCSFPQGFDSVVIHFDSHPPACQDWGPIFLADNMRVTPISSNIISENEPPKMFSLSQNYPNPFNGFSSIKYSIPKSSQVTLKIFNTLGEEIEILVNEEKTIGTYEVNWNAASATGGLPSGVYFYRLQAGDFVKTRKMILLK
jgi:hypothetical protein